MFKAHESVGLPSILSKHLQKMDQLGFSAEDKMATCHDIVTRIAEQQTKEKRNLYRGEVYNIVKEATPELETMEKMTAQAATPMQTYMPVYAYGLLGEIPIDEQIKRNFGIGARSYIEDNDPFITAPPAVRTNPFTGEQVEPPKNQASMGSILADGLGLQKVETDKDREFQDDFRSASLFGSPWGMIKNGFKKAGNLASGIWNGGKKLDDATGAAAKKIDDVGNPLGKIDNADEAASLRVKNMEPPKPSPALQKKLDELQSGSAFPHNPDNLHEGSIKVVNGAKPKDKELRGAALFKARGYEVEFLPEVNNSGIKAKTADTNIKEFGRVEFYQPETNSIDRITDKIADKGKQSSTLLIQKDLALQEMEEIAKRVFGKPNCQHMKYMFFEHSNGQVLFFKKS